MSRGLRIGIIGGGASGAIALCHLLRTGLDAKIDIFEPGQLGFGVAFSSSSEKHLLNVPAAKMFIDSTRPHEFLDWLCFNYPNIQTSVTWPFVPRFYFGQFLNHSLIEFDGQFQHHKNRILSIHFNKEQDLFGVRDEAGFEYGYDFLILSTGYQQSPDLSALNAGHLGVEHQMRVFGPYPKKDNLTLGQKDSVLVIGTGLSAIDANLELRSIGVKQIFHVSRRGRFPYPFSEEPIPAGLLPLPNLFGRAPLECFRYFRRVIDENRIDAGVLAAGLRDQAQVIWVSFTERQKAQFLRHLKTHWNRVRHRAPPFVLNELQEAERTGHVSIIAGSIVSTTPVEGGFHVRIRNRAGHIIEKKFTHIQICTEIKSDQQFSELQNEPKLFRLGPLLRETFWETTAIREIALASQAIASKIQVLRVNFSSEDL